MCVCLPHQPCRLKYLGIYFVNKKGLGVDVSENKRKFYASCNSVLCQSKYACEIVKVTLIRFYCWPLLTYCIGSLRLTAEAIRQLEVCWNDAFCKIFNYSRMESVKLLQFFSCPDIKHYYNLRRWKFLLPCATNCKYLSSMFCVQNFKYGCILVTLKTIMIVIHYVQKLTVLLHPPFIVTLLQLYLDVCDRFNCLISYFPVCLFLSFLFCTWCE